MDSGLLKKLFGQSPKWHGPCTVIVDAEASVKSTGQDAMLAGGIKAFAPRVTSGRIAADAVCFNAEHNALFVVQRVRGKQTTGEDTLQQTVIVVDVSHVVGVEFEGIDSLAPLGISVPPMPDKPHYTAGMLVG
jgi:hypothetical protein